MTATADAPATDSRGALVRLLFGFFPAQALQVGAKLGVADHLVDGPRPTAELAAATGTDPGALARLLRALALFGVVEEPTAGTWSLGPHGGPLRSDSPDSIRNLAQLFCGEEVWSAWGQLEEGIRTGRPVWEKLTGHDTFGFMDAHPAFAAMFNRAMSEATRNAVPGIVAVGGFDRFGTVVDVGGGDGTLLAGVLAATPGLTGAVLDTATGTSATRATFEAVGVADRAEVVVGDFFAAVPPADCHLVKSVVHDWPDDDAVRLLSACRAGLADDGVVLVVEPVLPPRASADPSQAITVMSDLNMLVCAGGLERTEDGHRAVLERAGLALRSVTPCPGPTNFSVIEAVPAPG